MLWLKFYKKNVKKIFGDLKKDQEIDNNFKKEFKKFKKWKFKKRKINKESVKISSWTSFWKWKV